MTLKLLLREKVLIKIDQTLKIEHEERKEQNGVWKKVFGVQVLREISVVGLCIEIKSFKNIIRKFIKRKS